MICITTRGGAHLHLSNRGINSIIYIKHCSLPRLLVQLGFDREKIGEIYSSTLGDKNGIFLSYVLINLYA